MSARQPQVIPLALEREFYIDEGCFVIELCPPEHDPDLSIARCRVEPGKTTRWHRLHGTVERYVIQQGEGLVEVGDLSAQRVQPGDMVLIPAGVRQRIANCGPMDLVFLALCTPRFTPACYEDIQGVEVE